LVSYSTRDDGGAFRRRNTRRAVEALADTGRTVIKIDQPQGPAESGPQPKGHSMRIAVSALSLILLASMPALAGQTEGRIKSVDEEKLTITLDDGKSYKLPGEVDMAGIEPGAEIVINFDKVGEVNQITDMAVYE
jgi:hypothetical protein